MKPCQNCRRPADRLRRGLCPVCYSHEQANGRPRPKIVYNKTNRKCCNCGVPLPVKNGKGYRRYCPACYMYQWRNGLQRPVEPVRWCDCGRPATHQIKTRGGMQGRLTLTIDLCDECYQLEKSYAYQKSRIKSTGDDEKPARKIPQRFRRLDRWGTVRNRYGVVSFDWYHSRLSPAAPWRRL
jgi:hypothetical protein